MHLSILPLVLASMSPFTMLCEVNPPLWVKWMFEVDVDELISWRECDENMTEPRQRTLERSTLNRTSQSLLRRRWGHVETDADVEMCRDVLLRVHLHVFLISSAWRQIVLMQSAQDEDEDEDQKKEEKEGSFCSQKVHWYRSNRLLFEGPVR